MPKAKPKAGHSPKKRNREPETFSDRVAEAIVKRVQRGTYLRVACTAEGVQMSRFWAWVKRGHEDRRAGLDTRLARFAIALDKADALAESTMVDVLHTIATQKGDLAQAQRAAESVLKRRFRKRWGDSVENRDPDDAREAEDAALRQMLVDTFGADPVVEGEIPDGTDEGEDDDV
jgi:hypothetical protein